MKKIIIMMIICLGISSSLFAKEYHSMMLNFKSNGTIADITETNTNEMIRFLSEKEIPLPKKSWELCKIYNQEKVKEDIKVFQQDEIIYQQLSNYVYLEGAYPARFICIEKGLIKEDWVEKDLKKYQIKPYFNTKDVKDYKLFPYTK